MATPIASVRSIFMIQLPRIMLVLKTGISTRQCINVIRRSVHYSTSSPILVTHRLLPKLLHGRCCPQLYHLKDIKGLYCPQHMRFPGISVARFSSSNESLSNEEEEDDTLYKWIELKVKGHDNAVLDSYQTFVASAAKELDIKAEILENPARNIYRLTLLKSRHIHKKHRVQYEMRTNYRLMKLKHLTGSTADVFLEYIERNLPEGIAMQVKKCSIEQLPEHLSKPPEGLVDPSEDVSMDENSSSPEESKSIEDSSSSPEEKKNIEDSRSSPQETESIEDTSDSDSSSDSDSKSDSDSSSSDSDSDSSSSDSDSDEEDKKKR